MRLAKDTFRKSAVYKVVDSWIETEIASDFVIKEYWTENGEFVEPKFDASGLMRTKEACFQCAWEMHERIMGKQLAVISKDDLHIDDGQKDIYVNIVLGILYAIMTQNYPNLKPGMGNRYIVMRQHEQVLTDSFINMGMLSQWLRFYSLLRPFVVTTSVPKLFQSAKAMQALQSFREAGYLDDGFKPVRTKILNNIQAAALADAIYERITGKNKGTRWKVFEDWWEMSSLKQDKDRNISRGNGKYYSYVKDFEKVK